MVRHNIIIFYLGINLFLPMIARMILSFKTRLLLLSWTSKLNIIILLIYKKQKHTRLSRVYVMDNFSVTKIASPI